jgi:hypothetical protein
MPSTSGSTIPNQRTIRRPGREELPHSLDGLWLSPDQARIQGQPPHGLGTAVNVRALLRQLSTRVNQRFLALMSASAFASPR